MLWNRGTYIADTINGLRGVDRRVFTDLRLASVGYTIEYEMTIRAMKQRLIVAEIPTQERERIGGETKAPSLQTGFVFLRFLPGEIVRG